MTFIEVIGNVNKDGRLEAQVPDGTPVGKVNIIILVDSDEDAADEARWDESFRKSKDKLMAMARKAVADRKAGLSREIDLDVDLNEPDDTSV